MHHWTNALVKLNACNEAVEWAKTQPSLAAAWKNCKRGDWMMWLLGRTCKGGAWSDERKPIVACAAECASTTEKYVHPDSLLAWMWCIDACERWSRGEADRDEVEAARSAAAADDADAVYAAAAAAAAAAAYAAADDAADAAAAKKTNQLLTANICREILTKEVLSKYRKLK